MGMTTRLPHPDAFSPTWTLLLVVGSVIVSGVIVLVGLIVVYLVLTETVS